MSGAPDEASFYQNTGDQVGYILDGGGIYWWWNSQDNSWNKDYSDVRTMQSLNDLRTAITLHDTKHDEFKVGDLVVVKANPFWPEDYLIQKVEPEHIGKWYMNSWRHATPEEIKAGHRLEAERHG